MTPLPPGLYEDLPAAEYHLQPGASASRLMKLWKSTPAHLRLQLDEPFEPTPSMFIGTLGHALMLEPEKELPKLWVKPETYLAVPLEEGRIVEEKPWSGNAKVCKSLMADARALGLIPITRDDYDNAHAAAKALSQHSLIKPVLRDCQTELTIIIRDSRNEVNVRCRYDVKPARGHPNLADCKFTGCLDVEGWPRHAYNSGYHIQVALNLEVWNSYAGADDPKTGFEFWVVENKAPFDVVVFECTPEFIERGRLDFYRLLAVYAECERSGVWPGTPPMRVECGLPGWVKTNE